MYETSNNIYIFLSYPNQSYVSNRVRLSPHHDLSHVSTPLYISTAQMGYKIKEVGTNGNKGRHEISYLQKSISNEKCGLHHLE